MIINTDLLVPHCAIDQSAAIDTHFIYIYIYIYIYMCVCVFIYVHSFFFYLFMYVSLEHTCRACHYLDLM